MVHLVPGVVTATVGKFLTIAGGARDQPLQKRDMTLGEMRTLLKDEGIRLTRSLGQSFLHDQNQLGRIVSLAAPMADVRVLEIGPGLGPLTEALLKSGTRVLAIEKDRRLAAILRRRLGSWPSLQVVEADAVDWITREPRDLRNWQIVANLPYSVGSVLLVHLAQLDRPPRSITVTLQSEVVDRIRARPGTAAFGVLTLLLAESLAPVSGAHFTIPPTSFFPPPRVMSACIRLEPRVLRLVEAQWALAYRRLVKEAFSQRRKQLRKVLRRRWPDPVLDRVWKALQLAPDVRAEVLAPEQFAALAVELGN